MGAKVTREISQEKHLKFRPDDFGQVFSPHWAYLQNRIVILPSEDCYENRTKRLQVPVTRLNK
jgi:hypothetical protein